MNDAPDTIRDRLIEDLREAVRARDEFIAIAAHELRNPLTPVVLRISTLARLSRSPNASVEQIASGLGDLEAYIRNYIKRATTLLDVSRITSGQLVLNPEKVDLSAAVRRIAEEARPIAGHVGCSLRITVEDGVRGEWDRLAVEEIVENLLSNALKYGAGKPVDLALSATASHARLIVRDRGDGIAPADRERIFQRFERAVAGSKRAGFGIGLWLVGRLVAAMNGDIKVESETGAGTSFTVMLPLKSEIRTDAAHD